MMNWLDAAPAGGRKRRGTSKAKKGDDELEFDKDIKRQQTQMKARKSIFVPKKAEMKK